MLNSKEFQLARASGLSFVCCSCTKWSEGIAKGLGRCTAEDGCGSPIVRDTFHEYVGPIRDFTQICFVCGTAAKKGIRVAGHVRVIGVCNQHVSYLTAMAPADRRRLPVLQQDRIVFEAQTGKPFEAPKPEKTLGNLMSGIVKPDEDLTK